MTLADAYQRLNLQVDLIPSGRRNRPGIRITPAYITIHNTENNDAGADALRHARYLKTTSDSVSWHFTVDDVCAVKHLPTSEKGWHAATALGNRTSLGIEICEHPGIDQDAANDRAALLTAVLLHAYGLTHLAIVPHQRWSGKHCPHRLLDADDGLDWHGFVERARGYLHDLQAEERAGRPGVEAADVDSGADGGVSIAPAGRTFRLTARPDTLDFRDRMFEPTLVEVPPRRPLNEFRRMGVPILDQGSEGACTGFGLATLANYLLLRLGQSPDASPRMLYEMARRYDEFPGEDGEGSSARGAMKGWHKHGVCSAQAWAYVPGAPHGEGLTPARSEDALRRPLGAYYRVNHQDLVTIHCALTEVGALYATAQVHTGWESVDPTTGAIPYDGTQSLRGGHAFAVVGYDEEGLWIQNSWGDTWGMGGFAHLRYADWMANATDLWVARLGAPVRIDNRLAHTASSAEAGQAPVDLRPHIVSLRNDGLLSSAGAFGQTERELRAQFQQIAERIRTWERKRIVLYAHGGLVGEASAVARVAALRDDLLQNQVYPVAFLWHSDYLTTLTNVLRDALGHRREEGALDAAKDFLLDRLDDTLEPLARALTGKLVWDQMKQNALAATTGSQGGARLVAELIDDLLRAMPETEIHLVGHSAGAIFLAPLLQLLVGSPDRALALGPLAGERGLGRRVHSATLWAPAATVDLFKATYLPAFRQGALERLSLFALTDAAEQDDDCARIYHKSLLYLVSNAFEARVPNPILRREGTPIVGMQKFLERDPALMALFRSRGRAELVLAPNAVSAARHHGDFDDDPTTLQTTLRWITAQSVASSPTKPLSKARREARRQEIQQALLLREDI